MNAPTPDLHDASIPDAPATTDPVLAALHDARDRRDQADRDIRILLAYARELTSPRPYRLADLAAAAGDVNLRRTHRLHLPAHRHRSADPAVGGCCPEKPSAPEARRK